MASKKKLLLMGIILILIVGLGIRHDWNVKWIFYNCSIYENYEKKKNEIHLLSDFCFRKFPVDTGLFIGFNGSPNRFNLRLNFIEDGAESNVFHQNISRSSSEMKAILTDLQWQDRDIDKFCRLLDKCNGTGVFWGLDKKSYMIIYYEESRPSTSVKRVNYLVFPPKTSEKKIKKWESKTNCKSMDSVVLVQSHYPL